MRNPQITKARFKRLYSQYRQSLNIQHTNDYVEKIARHVENIFNINPNGGYVFANTGDSYLFNWVWVTGKGFKAERVIDRNEHKLNFS